jgi:hypothetical protein
MEEAFCLYMTPSPTRQTVVEDIDEARLAAGVRAHGSRVESRPELPSPGSEPVGIGRLGRARSTSRGRGSCPNRNVGFPYCAKARQRRRPLPASIRDRYAPFHARCGKVAVRPTAFETQPLDAPSDFRVRSHTNMMAGDGDVGGSRLQHYVTVPSDECTPTDVSSLNAPRNRSAVRLSRVQEPPALTNRVRWLSDDARPADFPVAAGRERRSCVSARARSVPLHALRDGGLRLVSSQLGRELHRCLLRRCSPARPLDGREPGSDCPRKRLFPRPVAASDSRGQRPGERAAVAELKGLTANETVIA